MRYFRLVCSAIFVSNKFHVDGAYCSIPPECLGRTSFFKTQARSPNLLLLSSSSNNNESCGCGSTVYEGKPSSTVLRDKIDHRSVIAGLPIYSVHGEQTNIDNIIGKADETPDKVSLVVFLRSLG